MTAGGFDVQALLAQAQRMQEQLAQGQRALAELRVEGSAGGGLVTATLSGEGDLVDLRIDRAAIDPEDADLPETLADLVLAAVRDAREQVARAGAQQMAPVTQALGGLAGGAGGAGGGGLGGLGELLGGFGGGAARTTAPTDAETGRASGDAPGAPDRGA